MSSSMHQIISARQLLLFSLHSFMVCTIIPVCRASVTKNPDQALDPRELRTGINVPGSLSETDPYDHWKFYSGARQNAVTWLLLLVGLGIPELLVIW
ncbi:hypothetical protein DKX38_005861 [Salix brachista]|uniref:Chlorophyll a-b binding protein, chloroplastic n=1 Tax=Salix brachista TaxID=2182728 RepID=A0A5N5N0L9_9ROSI|nr:hypothetical protein DKX38_005861 [Salix brachista]